MGQAEMTLTEKREREDNSRTKEYLWMAEGNTKRCKWGSRSSATKYTLFVITEDVIVPIVIDRTLSSIGTYSI
jgi:hypothetical protein